MRSWNKWDSAVLLPPPETIRLWQVHEITKNISEIELTVKKERARKYRQVPKVRGVKLTMHLALRQKLKHRLWTIPIISLEPKHVSKAPAA